MKLTDRISKKIERSVEEGIGSLKQNAVRTFWVQKPRNFGDLLNPVLLRYYNLTPVHTDRNTSALLCIGSLLQNLSENFSGAILGTGLVDSRTKRFPNATVVAVRGALTRELLGLSKETPLGDPGLLVSMVYKFTPAKKYVLGLTPHYFDKEDPRLVKIQKKYPNEVKLIDVQRSPKRVIEDITQCEFILSSCLHGLVSADALGIPNAWVYLSEKVTGAGFKFHDYASALGRKITPHSIDGNESLTDLCKITQEPEVSVPQITLQLDQLFRDTAKLFRSN